MKKLIFLIAMLCTLSITVFASQTVYVSGFGDDCAINGSGTLHIYAAQSSKEYALPTPLIFREI